MSTLSSTIHTLKDGRIVTIRSAMETDAAELLAFDKRILLDNDFAGREVDEINPSAEEKALRIEKHRTNPGHLWLVAEHDGDIVGTINLWNGDSRRIAHVGTFGIGLDHGWRGVGLGTMLLDCLLRWAEQDPLIEKVALGVFASNERAMRLYKKFGFIQEGRKYREIKFGSDRYVDDISMYKWVKQNRLSI